MSEVIRKTYSLIDGRAQYLNMSAVELVEIIGVESTEKFLKDKQLADIKTAANIELAKYDWMYIRQVRNADSPNPMPVSVEVEAHYSNVIAWSNTEQQKLEVLTVEELDLLTVNAPTL
jgi:hypothetical protein